MARAALRLGVRELADAAKVSTQTITRLEAGETLRDRTVDDIARVLVEAGVLFVDANDQHGPGVCLALK